MERTRFEVWILVVASRIAIIRWGWHDECLLCASGCQRKGLIVSTSILEPSNLYMNARKKNSWLTDLITPLLIFFYHWPPSCPSLFLYRTTDWNVLVDEYENIPVLWFRTHVASHCMLREVAVNMPDTMIGARIVKSFSPWRVAVFVLLMDSGIGEWD